MKRKVACLPLPLYFLTLILSVACLLVDSLPANMAGGILVRVFG
jgi:Na+/citrate or Na+/malate symporter